jgi:hypothetical protein
MAMGMGMEGKSKIKTDFVRCLELEDGYSQSAILCRTEFFFSLLLPVIVIDDGCACDLPYLLSRDHAGSSDYGCLAVLVFLGLHQDC